MRRREERGRAVEFPLDLTSGPRFSIAGEALDVYGHTVLRLGPQYMANKTDEDFSLSQRFCANADSVSE
jgi:hypothetical protein